MTEQQVTPTGQSANRAESSKTGSDRLEQAVAAQREWQRERERRMYGFTPDTDFVETMGVCPCCRS